ncbi:MAG: hypothetical protein IPN69_00405 [Acidobacteria bacterium]|nr:hypothetical protein [Acidobacteriota bacterium]
MRFAIWDLRFAISEIPDSRDSRSEIKIREFQGSRLGIPNRAAIASSRYHLR